VEQRSTKVLSTPVKSGYSSLDIGPTLADSDPRLQLSL